ncbi:MAG: hypothetical protein QNK37_16565 [Acidobacteriota bacterium]|nr:hypothetical protein [Acidobacteriota bacterium]
MRLRVLCVILITNLCLAVFGMQGDPIGVLDDGDTGTPPLNHHLQAKATIAIAYGETYSGTIDNSVDTFSFTALQGDRFHVYMGVTSGSLDPYITAYNPDGDFIFENYERTWGLAHFWVRVGKTGTHSIRARDYGNDNTGNYELKITRLNNPPGAIPLTFGQTYMGNLAKSVDSFSFSAIAGDRIHVYMNSDAVDPTIYLFGPDGTTLMDNHERTRGMTQFWFRISETGVYSLQTFDYGRENSGDYQLKLNRLNNPPDAIPLDFGETYSGNIQKSVDTFSFSAIAGDRIHAYMNSNAIDPTILLFGPDGTTLADDHENTWGLAQFWFSIPETGVYSLQALDYDWDHSGEYKLTLNRLNNPPLAIPLNFGETFSGNIQKSVDTFSFSAIAGDRIHAYMNSDAIDPTIFLFGPDGTTLADDHEKTWELAQFWFSIPETGVYSLQALDYGREHSGDYKLRLNRLNNPPGAIPLNFGETFSGDIQKNVDTFSFTAIAGDRIHAYMKSTAVDPGIYLFGPDGITIANDYEQTWGLAQFWATAPTTGVYAVQALDYGRENSGDYELQLNRLNNPAGAVQLEFGQIYSGYINKSVDTFSFQAIAGDHIYIDMGSADIDPQILLFGPNGSTVASNYENTWGLARIWFVAEETGVYAIQADDYRDDNSGSYKLFLTRFNSPPNAIPLQYGESFYGSILRNSNVFSFEAVAGDRISLSMSSDAIDSAIYLYGPDGKYIFHDWDSRLAQFTSTAATSGTYAIWAGDWNREDNGIYTISLTRLNNPPATTTSVTIVEPTPGEFYTSQFRLIDLAGSASSGDTVTKVTWSNNRGGNGEALGTNRWSITDLPLRPGDNEITVTAHDDRNRTGTDTITIHFPQEDQEGPVVTIVIPTGEESYETDQPTVNLAGTATDENEILSMSWRNDRGGEGPVSGIASWSINNLALEPGLNTITVSARDESDNEGTDFIRITYRPPGGANVILPDPALKGYLVGLYDNDGDGEISFEEADAVEVIDAANLDISDLTGVESFAKLRRLDVPGNALTVMPDLSGLSDLAVINLDGNQLTAVSALPAGLTSLSLFGNGLTEVPDIGSLDELNLLDLRNNLLDEGDCPDLEAAKAFVQDLIYASQKTGALRCGDDSDKLAIRVPSSQERIAIQGTLLSSLKATYLGEGVSGSFTWRTDGGASGFAVKADPKTDEPGAEVWRAYDIELEPGNNTIWVEAIDAEGNLEVDSIQVFASAKTVVKPIVEPLFPRVMPTGGVFTYEVAVTEGTNPVSRIEWDFDGEEPLILHPDGEGLPFSISHSFTREGTYTVRALVFDEQDFFTEIVHKVKVEDPNEPPLIESFTASAGATREGDEVDFTVIATDPNQDRLYYTWLIIKNGVQVLHRWTGSAQMSYGFPEGGGNYDVTVIVTDSDKLVSETLTISVEDVDDPTITLEPNYLDASLCRAQESNISLDVNVANLTGGSVGYRTQIFYLDESPVNWLEIDTGQTGTLRFGDNPMIAVVKLVDTHLMQGGKDYRANVVFSDAAGEAPDATFQVFLSIGALRCQNQVFAKAGSVGNLSTEWTFYGSNITDYDLIVSGVNESVPLRRIRTSKASMQVGGLEDNRHYRITVQARDGNGVVAEAETIEKTAESSDRGYVTYFDHIAQNSGFWTGVALVNPHEAAAAYTLIARNRKGLELSRQQGTLLPGQKRLDTIDGFFDQFDPATKSLEVLSERPLDTLELFGTWDQTQMTGLPTGDHLFYTAHILLGPCRSDGRFSTFGLFNPSEGEIEIEVEGFDTRGRLVGVGNLTLDPKSQTAACAQDLIDEPPASLAWLRLRGSGAFSGFNLWGKNVDHLSGSIFVQTGALENFVPRVEPAGLLYIANAGDITTNIRIEGFTYDGGAVLQETRTLRPRELITLTTDFYGHARISAEHPLLVTSELNRPGPDRYSEAVPAQTQGYNALMMPHVARPDNFKTEVFVLNIDDQQTFFSIKAYDASGNLVGAGDAITLPANGGWTADVSQLFDSGSGVAYLKLIGASDASILGQALFSTHPRIAGQMGGFVLTPLTID